eukprot:g30852.t1
MEGTEDFYPGIAFVQTVEAWTDLNFLVCFFKEIFAPALEFRMGGPGSGSPKRPVLCQSTGEVYESVTAAARAVNRGTNNICRAIVDRRPCAGMMWTYAPSGTFGQAMKIDC